MLQKFFSSEKFDELLHRTQLLLLLAARRARLTTTCARLPYVYRRMMARSTFRSLCLRTFLYHVKLTWLVVRSVCSWDGTWLPGASLLPGHTDVIALFTDAIFAVFIVMFVTTIHGQTHLLRAPRQPYIFIYLLYIYIIFIT